MSVTPLEKFHVYSDVSYRFGIMAYAAIVIGPGVDRRWSGVINGERRTSVAEIVASSVAASELPDGATVVIHTDLEDLPRMFQEPGYGQRDQRYAVAKMREATNRYNLEIVIDRKSGYYRMCHREARIAAHHRAVKLCVGELKK